MVSLDPRNWGKKEVDPRFMDAALTTGIHQSAKNSTDIEFERELGVNRELLHDPRFESLLEDDIYIKRPLTDEKGNIVTDENNRPQYVIIGRDKNAMALRALFSQLNRTSFITEKKAEYISWVFRGALVKMEASKPESTYSMSDMALNDVLEMMGEFAISDNIKGRKALLLKRSSRATAVEVSQRTNNKGESIV